MRDIKFKAKNLGGSEWVYGHYFTKEDGNSVQLNHYILYRGLSCPVDPKTVCQYTGLKDKNGKGIYEGDIILTEWRLTLKSYSVYYDKSSQWSIVSIDEDRNLQGLYDYHFDCEITGSIHDTK